MLNTVGLRLAMENSNVPKGWLNCQCHQTSKKGSYCFLTHSKTLTNWNPYGINGISIRILILFHFCLITYFFLKILVSTLSPQVNSLCLRVNPDGEKT